MKHYCILLVISALTLTAVSCNTVGRIAAKYQLNREIKEFVSNCEDKVSKVTCCLEAMPCQS